MKYQSFILFLVLTFLLSQAVPASSLGNHNKKFTLPSMMDKSDWSNKGELQRVWQSALVRIPESKGGYASYTMSDVTEQFVESGKRFPTVIYLHGCAGVWAGTYTRLNFLAKSGFAVIAPVSFAREKYPQSCDPALAKGGMYRGTLNMRQNDAEHAITNAKKLVWVDKDNVFLMGHSQGGVTTATLKSNDAQFVNARVIEAWTCHAGWDEYKGINASSDEPVLALVGQKDPWFQNQWTRGDCGKFIDKHNGSRSIVFTKGMLSTRHELLEDSKVQEIVLEFLRNNMR